MNTHNTPRDVAVHAHRDCRYGGKPYETHLDEVVEYLDAVAFGVLTLPAALRSALLAVGYLHDTVEDTDMTEQEIEDKFGAVIAKAVMFCTDAEGKNRAERKRATYLRMRDQVNKATCRRYTNPDRSIQLGVMAKMADRICNLRATLRDENIGLARMYLRERDAFLLALKSPLLPRQMIRDYDQVSESLVEMIKKDHP